MRIPDYAGRSLANLVSHLERGLGSETPTPGLSDDLAEHVPTGRSTVLVLFDGLGFDMVQALADDSPLKASLRHTLDAPFSTQTSVSTATLASGLPPSQHGIVGYLIHVPETDAIVNTLWWMGTAGEEVEFDLETVLPAPNVAERLAAIDGEVVVVEPAGFLGSPLDTVLYRGAQTVGVDNPDRFAAAVVEAASEPRRLIVAYVPYIDAAGHSFGPGSAEHRAAIADAADLWGQLTRVLPPDVTLVGTADHGMITPATQIDIEAPNGVRIGGDNRVLFLYGQPETCERFSAQLPGMTMPRAEMLAAWGPGPHHPAVPERLPQVLHLAPDATTFHHAGSPMHLAGHHGGLTDAEVQIPLLVR